jgi:homoserine O-acetyltransferase
MVERIFKIIDRPIYERIIHVGSIVKRGANVMYVEKRKFSVTDFTFDAGVTLPVEIGYETYGTLNEDRSNAILICHFFSATSHAASRGNGSAVSHGQEEQGWWDALIGPQKAFDTDRFFVICSDVICNVNAKNPSVYTTGPASVNPMTGEKYGLSFPQVTIRDFVRLQRRLLHALGIERLYCVAGPSMGGMQALQWAVDYPQDVQKVVVVISGGRTPSFTSVMPLQVGIDAIFGSEMSGLRVAVKAMTIQARCVEFAKREWGYPVTTPSVNGKEQPFSFHKEIDALVEERIRYIEPLHWAYISRACQLYNLENGYGSYEQALSRIQADVLAIPCSTDLLFPPEESRDLVERLRKIGKNAFYYELESPNGHLAGVFECEKISEPIRSFLQ